LDWDRYAREEAKSQVNIAVPKIVKEIFFLFLIDTKTAKEITMNAATM
jgi:hypothetical protein